MATRDFKRKLSAILSADVAGYSRLMGEDEAATVEAITTYREIMDGLIQKHRGRVVDSPGDNLLAEFLSVVDTVRCSVEIQRELAERNSELAANRRMRFRIGVDLGGSFNKEYGSTETGEHCRSNGESCRGWGNLHIRDSI
jgi:adenylate cyclase